WLQLEIRCACLELEERGEIDVSQAVPDQADDDLVGERRDRHGHVELSGGVQPEFEVLAQQVASKGRREIEVDERWRLVAAEGGAHHTAVDELQVIGARDAAALRQDRGL